MPMGIEVIEYHTPLHIRSQAPPKCQRRRPFLSIKCNEFRNLEIQTHWRFSPLRDSVLLEVQSPQRFSHIRHSGIRRSVPLEVLE
jgi:hypothetical protein